MKDGTTCDEFFIYIENSDNLFKNAKILNKEDLTILLNKKRKISNESNQIIVNINQDLTNALKNIVNKQNDNSTLNENSIMSKKEKSNSKLQFDAIAEIRNFNTFNSNNFNFKFIRGWNESDNISCVKCSVVLNNLMIFINDRENNFDYHFNSIKNSLICLNCSISNGEYYSEAICFYKYNKRLLIEIDKNPSFLKNTNIKKAKILKETVIEKTKWETFGFVDEFLMSNNELKEKDYKINFTENNHQHTKLKNLQNHLKFPTFTKNEIDNLDESVIELIDLDDAKFLDNQDVDHDLKKNDTINTQELKTSIETTKTENDNINHKVGIFEAENETINLIESSNLPVQIAKPEKSINRSDSIILRIQDKLKEAKNYFQEFSSSKIRNIEPILNENFRKTIETIKCYKKEKEIFENMQMKNFLQNIYDNLQQVDDYYKEAILDLIKEIS